MSHECSFSGCERTFETKRGKSLHESRGHTELYQDPEWLREQYIDNALNAKEIAEKCDTTAQTIYEWMDKLGIERRDKSEAKALEWENASDERRDEYAERMAEVGANHSVTNWHTFSEEERQEFRNFLSELATERNPPEPKVFKVEKTGHYVRSGWEKAVDLLLHEKGVEYAYEPQGFDCGEEGDYYPDFIVRDDVVIEVKGYVWDRNVAKAEQFMDKYPEYTYVVVGGREAQENMVYDYYIEYENKERIVELIDGGWE